MAKFYNVTFDYLLGLTETRQLSPLSTDSLRISDNAVKVLQDGKYNPLLLSEILTNDNFLRLMVDEEIYVDGNVATQIHILDKMVATVDEVAGFHGTLLQKFKLISRKWFGAKDIKLSDSADEQLETALNSDLLKPAKPDKKKNKKT